MTKKKFNYLLTIVVYFTITVAAFAQDDEEGPEGPPPASINKYLLLLAIVGIVFAWHSFKPKSAERAKAKHLKTTP